jgi:multiple sugar transport system permease protein
MEETAETKDFDAEVAAYERMHPNIDIVTMGMGVGNMNPQKLMTAIVGGVPPDVINQGRFQIGDWASRGAFEPLDKFLAADKNSTNPYAVKQSDYVPATWAEAVYKGHVYGIPNGVDVRLLFYNRQAFRNAGLDPSKPPQTWDEMIALAKKLTIKNPAGSYTQLGFDPTFAQGWLYTWSWQEDGDFMSPDATRCTIDNPQTLKALSSLVSWFDQLGGVDNIKSFTGSFNVSANPAQDPFLNGELAMKVEDDNFLTEVARYSPNLDFGTCPIPVPTDRLNHVGIFKNDPTYITWAGGYSYVIPRGSPHPKEAWQFIQWLSSPQAAMVGARAQCAYQQGLGRLYMPAVTANTRSNKMLFAKYLPLLPPNLADARRESLKILPFSLYRPVTFVGQLVWDQAALATDTAIRHDVTPQQALALAQQQVQTEIDHDITISSHPLLPAVPVVWGFGIVLLGLLGWLIVAYLRWRSVNRNRARADAVAGILFVLPWILGFLLFTLGPILASLVLSFCDYDVLHPARWAGISNYTTMATIDRDMLLKAFANMVFLSVFGIPLGMIVSLAMAMLLNTNVRGLGWYRTAFYIPSVVPIVATAVLWNWLLNSDPSRGLINALWLATVTHWFHIPPPGWEAVANWSKPGVVLMGLWGAGGGVILWLIGLQSIPKTLYEAASLDGAGWWSKFWNVTVPMLSPIIFFNIIMGLIATVQTFDSVYVLGNATQGGTTGPIDSLLTPVVYLFNNAFEYFKMGYASAIAWVIFVLIIALTLGQLKLAPRWVYYEGQKK